MKLGIVTDIHESVENLRAAISSMQAEGVDRIVSLGDFCETGSRLDETCEVLLEANVQGVWGNHDFGICEEARNEVLTRYGPSVAEFASAQQARLQIDQCLFMHVEPWLDPNRVEDLWYFEGIPDSAEKVQRIFADTGWEIAFAGHFHRWLAVGEMKTHDWNGDQPLKLDRGRHYVVIDACMNGSWAIFDTDERFLQPYSRDCLS